MKLVLFSFILFTACGGSSGSNGANGIQGVQGATGTITVTSSTQCTGTGSLSSNTLVLNYQSEIYSDGANYTVCSLSDGSHEYSDSNLNANNSTNINCSLVYTVSGSTGAYFTFNSQSAVYTDPSGGHNGYTVNLACKEN